MRSCVILEYLGLSAPWISRARVVTDVMKKIGPDSSKADQVLVARLNSKDTTGKKSEISVFLKERLRIREAADGH